MGTHGEMKQVEMDREAVLYVVRIASKGVNAPFDGIYGYEPIIFTSEARALAKEEELEDCDEWPHGAPEYTVEQTTLGYLLDKKDPALRLGIA